MENADFKNNKLIAEFMGAKFKVYPPTKTYKGETVMTNRDELDFPFDTNRPDAMKFKTSWEWLMPVVEKMRSVGADVNIYYQGESGTRPTVCYVYFPSKKDNPPFSGTWGVSKKEIGNRVKTMKEAVYNSVVEFIKWYNEQENK